jgi:hypothetical protein
MNPKGNVVAARGSSWFSSSREFRSRDGHVRIELVCESWGVQVVARLYFVLRSAKQFTSEPQGFFLADVRSVRLEPGVSGALLSFDMLSPSKRRRWNTLKVDAVAHMPPWKDRVRRIFKA